MAVSDQAGYWFNGFRLDPARRLLFGADGQAIPLKPKVFATLLYLVERAGELVAKEALLAAVWPHVVVEENNLNKAISTLRQVLGETREEHRFIVTEPGQGYRFVANVETSPSSVVGQTASSGERAPTHVPEAAAPARAPAEPTSAETRVEPRRRRAAIAALVSVLPLGLLAAGAWTWQQSSAARRARSETIPAIAALVDQDNLAGAFALAGQLPANVGDDPLLKTLKPFFTATYSVTTSPPGAEVLVRDYEAVDDAWQSLGSTPLADVAVPRRALRWRIEKEGFETVELATHDQTDVWGGGNLERTLNAVGTQPPDMVYVPGGPSIGSIQRARIPVAEVAPFFIDRYEVTNSAFKEFVDAGGYERRGYWEGLDFRKNGEPLSFDDAMALFVDATGRSGPATWELGDYPSGRGDYPVTGISWYEAAAYARYRGKSLPTVYHWIRATMPVDSVSSIAAMILPLSNFGSDGPAAVGAHQGVGPNGTYDMFGNVREWCANLAPAGGGWVIGGSWEGPEYTYSVAAKTALLERSRSNGFRLIQETVNPAQAATLHAPIDLEPLSSSLSSLQPVSDEVYAAYEREFAYRPGALNASAPVAMATTDNWIKQRVSIDVGYNNERMDVILFVPKGGTPPFQPVVFVSGIQIVQLPATIESIEPGFAPVQLDFVIRSGRMLVQPIFQGTYNRFKARIDQADQVRTTREWIERRWDLGRTIDYLETRSDVDASRLGYVGVSFGGSYALPLLAVEQRLKAAVLISGGLPIPWDTPLIEPTNYAPRITIPVLMLNGRFDEIIPLETNQLRLFELLGTPPAEKRHVLFETGHCCPPLSEVLRQTVGWFDTYLGPTH